MHVSGASCRNQHGALFLRTQTALGPVYNCFAVQRSLLSLVTEYVTVQIATEMLMNATPAGSVATALGQPPQHYPAQAFDGCTELFEDILCVCIVGISE